MDKYDRTMVLQFIMKLTDNYVTYKCTRRGQFDQSLKHHLGQRQHRAVSRNKYLRTVAVLRGSRVTSTMDRYL